MPKGLFTQSAVVLFNDPVSHGPLVGCLEKYGIEKRLEPASDPWMGGAGVAVPFRPEVNGRVIIDVVDSPWPDHMGDPQSDSMLFGAWAMGWFGPFVYPENLERAKAMSFAWEDATAVADQHRAFVRLKTSYVGAGTKDAPVLPRDYDPLGELLTLTDIARTILGLEGALAYFNPCGEVLLDYQGLVECMEWSRENHLPPLPVWSNVRLFRLSDTWTVMDTVGMEQLDVQDHEAWFETERYTPQSVEGFLRNAVNYVRETGKVIRNGDTIDGPGEVRWRAEVVEESLAPRPRSVLRWLPLDGTKPPQDE